MHGLPLCLQWYVTLSAYVRSSTFYVTLKNTVSFTIANLSQRQIGSVDRRQVSLSLYLSYESNITASHDKSR